MSILAFIWAVTTALVVVDLAQITWYLFLL